MPVAFTCAECSARYEVDADLAGKTIRCRDCGGFNRVPAPPRPPEPAPAKKPPEPPPLTVHYRCHLCGCDRRPVWRSFWTPASTTAALALLSALAGLGFVLLWVPGALFASVLWLPLLFSPLVRDWRQVCPGCKVRLG